jgi:hypothetical protein
LIDRDFCVFRWSINSPRWVDQYRRGGFIHQQSAATKSPNKNLPAPQANNRPPSSYQTKKTIHGSNDSGIDNFDRSEYPDRLPSFNGIDVRWLTGEVGGFLLIDFVDMKDFG